MVRRRKSQERRIARERIDRLFELAEREARQGHADRARRYVSLARKIGMRYNVRLPSAYKRRMCRQCFAFLLPPTTARVRIGGSQITTTCLSCGAIMRFPYREEQARGRQ